MLELESYDIWRKTKAPIIMMLGCLGVDTEVSNIGIKIIDFSKYRKVSRVNEDINGMLAVCYILIQTYLIYLTTLWIMLT